MAACAGHPLAEVTEERKASTQAPPRLYDLTTLLKDNDVHIMAITVLDTTDSSIIRVVVDDPDKARELLISNDMPYGECNLLAVEIGDEAELKGEGPLQVVDALAVTPDPYVRTLIEHAVETRVIDPTSKIKRRVGVIAKRW